MLNDIPGVTAIEAQGAFYCYPNMKDLLGRPLGPNGTVSTDTLQLADAILGEAKVAFVPGEAFGTPGYARFSFAMADADMEEGIRRYAAHLGASQKYHHTITLFWMRAVASALGEEPRHPSFDAFVTAHPELLDKALVERHFSPPLLESAAARSGWLEPDRLPLDRRATIGA